MISLNIVKCWLSTICKIRIFCEAYFANEVQNIYCQGVAGVLLSPFGAALPQGEGHDRKAGGGGEWGMMCQTGRSGEAVERCVLARVVRQRAQGRNVR